MSLGKQKAAINCRCVMLYLIPVLVAFFHGDPVNFRSIRDVGNIYSQLFQCTYWYWVAFVRQTLIGIDIVMIVKFDHSESLRGM